MISFMNHTHSPDISGPVQERATHQDSIILALSLVPRLL